MLEVIPIVTNGECLTIPVFAHLTSNTLCVCVFVRKECVSYREMAG